MFGIIYKAINKENGKCYIGQTAYSLDKRISGHLSSANHGVETAFHKAIRKYGINSFRWEVLCECLSREELNTQEIFYIEKYNSYNGDGYNMSYGGESNYGWKPSETTLKNFRKASKKRWSNSSERQKTSISLKEVYRNNKKLREFINDKIRESCSSEEFKKSQGLKQKALWKDPEYREKQMKTRNSVKFKKNLSNSIKKSWVERRNNG